MKIELFRDSPSGRLVPATAGEISAYAFVPNPLPPQLSLDPELVRVLSEADRALGELAGLGRTMSNPRLFIGPFVRREAVLSSRIEGTEADLADLYVYEAGQGQAPGSDVREVHNYVEALEYGLERLDTPAPISPASSSRPQTIEQPVENASPSLQQGNWGINLRLVRDLHARLMQGVRGERATPGEFRQTQNWIGSRRCTIADADFVPPPPAEMMVALEEWEKYIHGDDVYPPLIRLAFAHYQFETIHPFLDGNGRIGRLLLALLLVTWKLLPLPLLYLSAYFEQYRDDYYDLLLGVSEHGRWRDWIIFFLHGVAEQSRETIVRAKRLQDLQLEWHRRLLATPRTSVLLMHLVDELFQAPALTIPQVQELVGVTHRAASQMVDRLVEEFILYPVPGRQRNRQFVARKILEILGTEMEE